MSTFDKEESKARLDKQVEELRAKQAAGIILPVKSHEERQAAMLARDGIVDLGDVIKPVMEILERTNQSILEDAARYRAAIVDSTETNHCELCQTKREPHWERTFYESRMAGKLVIVWGSCPSCDAQRDEFLVNERWSKMGIPEKLLECTMENFKCETDQQTTAFGKTQSQIAVGRGFLILRGKVGTGKTHLAVGVIKQVGSGVFVTMADLVAELRETYSTNKGQETMVDKYRRPKVMVLDELTAEVKGVDIPQLLYRILGDRYNNNLLTVITSNEDLKTITDILGPRLTDRIRESLRIGILEGESYRARK